MDKRKRRLLCMLEGGKKYRWIRGVPPLSFRALAAGTLENYRIYGNTVGGESVGDRTGNLFDVSKAILEPNKTYDADGNIVDTPNSSYYNYFIPIDGNTTYTINAPYDVLSRIHFFDANKNWISRSDLLFPAYNYASSVTSPINSNYAVIQAANSLTDMPVTHNPQDLMLNTGSTLLPYEPYGYRVPVTVSNGTDTLTTPIYLPEQIKRVGDEAEYIDYKEQKLHRIGADDIDVTLPALPTLPGTNVLSVGTAVQPSNIEIKGKIKAL